MATYAHAPLLYEALDRVREMALLDGTSFTTGITNVWTPANAHDVADRMAIDPAPERPLSLDEKLDRQLADAGDRVRALAMDLRAWQLLAMFRMSGDNKRQRLGVLRGSQLPDLPAWVDDALDTGIVAWGAGHSQAVKQMLFLCDFAAWLSDEPPERRQQLLSDPWAFKACVFELPCDAAQMMREAVLHLVFPEVFDPVFNQAHKTRIVDQWSHLADGAENRDRALLAIRSRLVERFGEGFGWYEPRVKDIWDPEEEPPAPPRAGPAARQDALAGRSLASLAELADELLLDRQWLADVAEMAVDKGQLVLYGPPGTGKTFVALQLAAMMAGHESRTRLVQFHPSTSYEDFFEGYRPRKDDDGGMTYRIVPGPLRQIAEEAAADPEHTYVLVVDEINRANLPRVFGELLFLLEYRNREVFPLYQPDAPFSLPKNLVVLGTMNTADRSIALIDAALRRRFRFVPMFPDRSPVEGLLGRWTAREGADARWPRLLDLVNEMLAADLGGSDLLVGPSHFMADGGLDEEGARRAWTYGVYPAIEDHLFERPGSLARYRWEELLPRVDAAGPRPTPATPLGPSDLRDGPDDPGRPAEHPS